MGGPVGPGRCFRNRDSSGTQRGKRRDRGEAENRREWRGLATEGGEKRNAGEEHNRKPKESRGGGGDGASLRAIAVWAKQN